MKSIPGLTVPLLALVPLLLSTALRGDDLQGSRNILCATIESHECRPGGCGEVVESTLNIPRFVEIDTRNRTISTTAASGLNRRTVADTMTRDQGRLLLQGFENDRAYSLMVDEVTGEADFASAGFGVTVSVFAACTPVPGK